MYLTRISLNLRSSQVRRDISDPYEMHRTLTRAFVADEHTGVTSRFLWRLETMGKAWSKPVLLVQSLDVPDWTPLLQLNHYLDHVPETKKLEPEQLVKCNTPYRFRLVANPTVTRLGKRYGLLKESEQLEWLTRQGLKHGFSVQMALVSASDMINSRKNGYLISVQQACFEGVLQIQEDKLKQFIQGMLAGIGPAKAFGCGLLSFAQY